MNALLALVALEPSILETVDDDGTKRIGGIGFRPIRKLRWVVPTLEKPREFVDGLKLSMRHGDSPTHAEVAADHGYTDSWVNDIIRNIEEKGMGTTVETVVMLRESIPFLDHQMREGGILWPTLCEFVDYKRRRSGHQTAERLAVQAARRK